jgi:hypothetical protein
MRNEGSVKMASARYRACIVVIDVLFTQNLAAILKYVFPFSLHSSLPNE